MQLVNSSLDAFVKNLFYNVLKYFSQEFSGKFLELVKQKGIFANAYMNSFKTFFDGKLADRREFYSYFKDKCVSAKD